MIKTLQAILGSLIALNPVVTGLTAAVTFAIGLMQFFNGLWGTLIAKIAALTLPASTATLVVDGLSFANYVFPVTEFFAFFSLYCAAYVATAAIRIIKSFIPTVA